MTLSEYIELLQALEGKYGSCPVVMTQSGYYADGGVADLFDFPEVGTVDGKLSLVLGHSHQSY